MWRPLGLLCLAGVAADPTSQIEDLIKRQSELEVQLSELVAEREIRLANGADRRLLDSTLHIQALDVSVTGLLKRNVDLGVTLDYLWMLVCGAMVMFMQAGFAILESGACREKNAGVILMKNVLDVCVGTIVWYLIGYGLAYGIPDVPNSFLGVTNFAGTGFLRTDSEGNLIHSPHYINWFFQWAFCATAATIVSGAVAERIKFTAYVVYSVVMNAIIYPIIVYWTWSGHGWLSNMGYSDFAGSGIVHLTGGIGALCGAVCLGARKSRWDHPDPKEFDPHSMSQVVLGTFILWFGWYGFNCGSTLGFANSGVAAQAALVAMNTTVSASFGGLAVFGLRYAQTRKLDLAGTCNGILVGLVAVCAGVGDVTPHACILIGCLAGGAHEIGSNVLKKLKIDDPLDAFAVHGCGGMTGVLLRPLLDRTGVKGEMFGVHCLAVVVIIAWSGGISMLTLMCLKMVGCLRVDAHEEEVGADAAEMVAGIAHHSPDKDYSTPASPPIGAGGKI